VKFYAVPTELGPTNYNIKKMKTLKLSSSFLFQNPILEPIASSVPTGPRKLQSDCVSSGMLYNTCYNGMIMKLNLDIMK
jgi:hypothetical protein